MWSGARTDSRLLRLRNISPDKKGLYTCVASNAEGDGQSNAVNINVECKLVPGWMGSEEGFVDFDKWITTIKCVWLGMCFVDFDEWITTIKCVWLGMCFVDIDEWITAIKCVWLGMNFVDIDEWITTIKCVWLRIDFVDFDKWITTSVRNLKLKY